MSNAILVPNSPPRLLEPMIPPASPFPTSVFNTITLPASDGAINYHYSVSNEFYRLWLDTSMSYSCALYHPGDTLERAQQRKVDYHLNNVLAGPNSRLLDIGCGWSGVLQRMVETYGVSSAVGLTLSTAQAEFGQSLGLPQVEVREQSWAEHTTSIPYTGITAIGVLEHAVRPFLKRADKIRAYRHFFRKCHALLEPNGYLSIQTIVLLRQPTHRHHWEEAKFIGEEIFPESDLPQLHDILEALEGYFELVELRNDREDYAMTCHEWLARLQHNRALAVRICGEGVVQRYERYLASSAMLFSDSITGLLRARLKRLARSRG